MLSQDKIIKIKVLNCQKAKSCHSFLCAEMSLEKSIFLLQEPPLTRGRLSGFPKDYNIFGVEKARAAIAAPKGLNLWFCPELSDRDTCTVIIDIHGKKTLLVSIYCDGLLPPVSEKLRELKDRLANENISCILSGDFNSHSTLWNCEYSCPRALEHEMYIMEVGFIVENLGMKDTWVTKRARSKIDATLTYNCTISDWMVSEKYSFSDHQLITFKLNIGPPPKPKYFRNLAKCNWQVFRENLPNDEVNYNIWSEKTIEMEACKIEQDINMALSKSCPWSKERVANKPQSWWNEELFKEKAKVSTLAKKAYRSNLESDWAELRLANKKYAKNIRKAKRKNWQNFCEKVESPEQMSKFMKIIEKQNNKKIGLLKNPQGSYCRSPKEVSDLLLNTHVPGSTEQFTADNLLNFSKTCNKIDINEYFITEEMVYQAFKSFGGKKSAGPDKISAAILQQLTQSLIKRIRNLYSACILLNYSPLRYREANMIFIPKGGKKFYDISSSWRPITLSNFIFKGLERIIVWYIEQNILKENPISKFQHGCRQGYSCDSALSSLCSTIEGAICRSQYTIGLFLDIQNAFPTVKIESATEVLRHKGVPEQMVLWYKNYLEGRYISSEVLGYKTKRKLTMGLPQGGVASSLVFILIMDKLLEQFSSSNIKVLGFVDDGCLLVSGPVLSVLPDLMQSAIQKVLKWSEVHGLTLSPEKTKCIVFTNKQKIVLPKKLVMNNYEIPYVHSTRYLGITVDSKLEFKEHIQNKIKSAKSKLMILRSAMGRIWGAPPRTLLYAYQSIILPSLTFGSVIWYRACQSGFLKNQLSKLNRLISTTIMSMRYSTPSLGLEVILNIMPLHLKVVQEGLNAFARIKNIVKPIWDGIGNSGRYGHFKKCQKDLSKLSINLDNQDRDYFLNLGRKYKVNLDSKLVGNPIAHSNDIHCYTDGSKMNNIAGFGYIITDGDTEIAQASGCLGKNASVFQAEVYAIYRACIELSNYDKDVVIFTDSQSSIDALCKLKVKSSVVKNCINELNNLAERRSVVIRYIKAHNDWTGSEAADQAAKAGVTSQDKVNIPIPISKAKQQIKNAVVKIWNHEWNSISECRQTRQWFPTLNPKQSNNLRNLNRKDLSVLTQLLTGHNFLRYHESHICKDVSPLCRLCKEENETSFHLIGKCPVLMEKRKEIFHTYFLDENPDWTVFQIRDMIKGSRILGMMDGPENTDS